MEHADHNRRRAQPGAVNRKTQCAAILRLLKDARGEWVPLSKILDLHIGQYNARIFELRHELGLQIENKTDRDESGQVISWYRLISATQLPADRSALNEAIG